MQVRQASSHYLARVLIVLLLVFAALLPADQARAAGYSGCGTFHITYYYATGYRTRTNTVPHYGTVAVDPSLVRLRSRIWIHGLTTQFKAEDTGGAVVGWTLDVFVYDYAEGQNVIGRTAYRYACWRVP